MRYIVRELRSDELIRSTLSARLKWAIVPESQPERVLRRFRTRSEAEAVIKAWRGLVAAKGEPYPPPL